MHLNTAGQRCTSTDDYVHTHTHTDTRAHTHTHTNYTDSWGEGQCGSFSEKRNAFSLFFEGRENSRVFNVLGEVVPDVRTEAGQRAKAMGLRLKRRSLSMCVFDEERRQREKL